MNTMSSNTNTLYTARSLITMLPSEPSICIPRLFMNIQKERVYDVFTDLFGHNAIERVDMIERKNNIGGECKRAFIHFKSWPHTEQATEVRLKLLNGAEVKIMYDQPWFWRISASRVPRPENVYRSGTLENRPFIVIDESNFKDKDIHTVSFQHRPPLHKHSLNNRQYSHQPYKNRVTTPEIADWVEKSMQILRDYKQSQITFKKNNTSDKFKKVTNDKIHTHNAGVTPQEQEALPTPPTTPSKSK